MSVYTVRCCVLERVRAQKSIKFVFSKRKYEAGPGGRAIYGVRLRPLNCWDHGFESRSNHGCSSVEFVVCCVGSGLCDGLITRPEESYRLCVCVCACVCVCV